MDFSKDILLHTQQDGSPSSYMHAFQAPGSHSALHGAVQISEVRYNSKPYRWDRHQNGMPFHFPMGSLCSLAGHRGESPELRKLAAFTRAAFNFACFLA